MKIFRDLKIKMQNDKCALFLLLFLSRVTQRTEFISIVLNKGIDYLG